MHAGEFSSGVPHQYFPMPFHLLNGNLNDNEIDIFDINLPASKIIDDILSFTQIGESVAIVVSSAEEEEKVEPCKRIYLHAFSGARDTASVMAFKQSMAAHEKAGTNGPSGDECLLYTGHVGISFLSKSPIYGFNPDTGSLPGWKVIQSLKKGAAVHLDPFKGVISDDTSVFSKAKSLGLNYKVLEYVFPESKYNEIHAAFTKSKSHTGLTYSFPGKGGDCNCATWPREIGIPIPCGHGIMAEYIESFKNGEIRKKGECCDK